MLVSTLTKPGSLCSSPINVGNAQIDGVLKAATRAPHANGSVSDPPKSGNTSDLRAEKRATLCVTEASQGIPT